MNVRVRPATPDDIPALRALIAVSGIELSRGFYDDAQAAAMTREIYGVDSQLIDDGTYYVVEEGDVLVASGGWSRRGTLFGGDQAKQAHGGIGAGPDPLLDPAHDAARIRAFFVSPDHARRGLGSLLMRHCANAAFDAGFRRLTLVSTMPGRPLYAKFGFVVDALHTVTLQDGVEAPLATMSRALDAPWSSDELVGRRPAPAA